MFLERLYPYKSSGIVPIQHFPAVRFGNHAHARTGEPLPQGLGTSSALISPEVEIVETTSPDTSANQPSLSQASAPQNSVDQFNAVTTVDNGYVETLEDLYKSKASEIESCLSRIVASKIADGKRVIVTGLDILEKQHQINEKDAYNKWAYRKFFFWFPSLPHHFKKFPPDVIISLFKEMRQLGLVKKTYFKELTPTPICYEVYFDLTPFGKYALKQAKSYVETVRTAIAENDSRASQESTEIGN